MDSPDEGTMFKHTPKANFCGTYLLDHTTRAVLAVCRNKWKPSYTHDGDKGYGDEWTFTAANGQVFTVYTRWNEVHIGGVDGEVSASDLEGWLLAQAQPERVIVLMHNGLWYRTFDADQLEFAKEYAAKARAERSHLQWKLCWRTAEAAEVLEEKCRDWASDFDC